MEYERERTQHAAQIATLQRQVEHCARQVTRLIADYRTLAENVCAGAEADVPARPAARTRAGSWPEPLAAIPHHVAFDRGLRETTAVRQEKSYRVVG